jgi:hypothetical protein
MVTYYENLLENQIPFIIWLLITIKNKHFMKLIQNILFIFTSF